MNYYADVILPLPLQGTFTYQLSLEQSKLLGIGHRVAVSFGRRKILTGVIKENNRVININIFFIRLIAKLERIYYN